jgi:hypothetical protein
MYCLTQMSVTERAALRLLQARRTKCHESGISSDGCKIHCSLPAVPFSRFT